MKRVAVFILLGLITSACRIDVDLRLDLRRDGSGDLDLNIVTDAEFERLYRFTDAELEEFIVLTGEDIGLTFEVAEDIDKTYHASAKSLSPESIERVLENLIPELGTVDIAAQAETLVITGDFKPLPESQILDPFFENFDAAQLAESADITMTVSLPGELDVSSASQVEGNTLTFEIPFDNEPIRIFARTGLIPEDAGGFPWGLAILAIVIAGALAFLVAIRKQAGQVTETPLGQLPSVPYAPEHQPVAPPSKEQESPPSAQAEELAEPPAEVMVNPEEGGGEH